MIELGTKNHPYKELDSVFVELMNFHTNTDRNITVYLMEASTSYLRVTAYVSNITHVSFEAYSEKSLSPKKARIVGVQSSNNIVPPGMATKFNILSKRLLFFIIVFHAIRSLRV